MFWRTKPTLAHDPAFWRAAGQARPRGFRLDEPLYYRASPSNRILTCHVAVGRARPYGHPLELDGVFQGRCLTHLVTFRALQVIPGREPHGAGPKLDPVGDATLFYDHEVAFLDGWSLNKLRGVHNLEALHAQFYEEIERYFRAGGFKALFVPTVPARSGLSEIPFTLQEAYWRFCAGQGYRRASWETLGKRLNGDPGDGLLAPPEPFDDGWEACTARRGDAPPPAEGARS